MPNLTIYVPDDLAAAIREHDVPVSATCQAALRRKVKLRERLGNEYIGKVIDQSGKTPAGRAS
jgi:hypothetical protein